MTMCDDESCSHSAGLSAVTANVNDAAGNSAVQASVNAWYDVTDPTTTIGSVDISADTGSSDTDFITKTAAQTVTATLSTALASDETLQISVNAGSSWSDDDHATGDGTGVSIGGVTLGAGTSSIKFRIVDDAGNTGAVSTTAYTLDTTAPTLGSVGIATAGTGNANDGDVITLSFTSSETIQTSPTCTFADSAGNAMDNSGSITYTDGGSNAWTCKITTHNSDPNGAITFSIAFTDVGGTAGVADTSVDDGSSVTIDNTHPTLGTVGIVDAGTGNANNGDDITLTFTGSETIQTPTCTIKDGGGNTMDNSVATTNTGGNVWTCVVETHDNDADGTVTFSIAFSDSAGNAGTADTTVDDGSSVTIDNTHPTLGTVGIATAGTGNANNGDDVTLTFTATETIGTPTCTMKDGGGNTMDNSVTTTHTGSNVWTCVVSTHDNDADGAMSFSIAFSDSAGNAGVADTTVDDSSTVTIDNTHPTLSSVSIATAGTGNANNGDDITLSFTASEGIQTPTCTIKDGGGNTMDNSVAVTEGSSNAWTCVVDTHDNDADGAVTFSIAFSDDANNAGTADTSVDDSSSVTIDNTHPTLTNIAMTTSGNSGYAKSGDTVTLTITVSESVTSLACTIDGEAATMGGSGTSWTAALTASGDETAGSATFSCGSHVDAAGNTGAADTTADSGAVTFDFVVPTLGTVGIATAGTGNANNGDDVTLTFTASETIQTPTCTMKDGGGNTMDNSVTTTHTGSNVWTCVVSTHDNDADGAMSFSIAFSDSAGNAGTADTTVDDSSTVTIDNAHPTLSSVSIATAGTGNANDGDDVTLSFTASEGIQTPTCTMKDGGGNTMDNSVSVTEGSSNAWTCVVEVNNADVNGAMTFSIAFTDVGGTAGVADTSVDDGSSVTIDNTHPTMTPVSIAVDNTGNANDGDDITLSFTTSEGIQTPTCTFTSGGAAMADSSITVAEGNNNAWTCVLDVANGDTDGGVAFSIAFTDDAGNAGTAVSAVTDGTSVTVDNTHPTVSSITFADTALKAGETSLVTIVFSEAVASFANADPVSYTHLTLPTNREV